MGQVSTDAGHGARDPGLSPKAVSLHGLIPTSRPRSWQIWMSTEIPKSHISILLTRNLLKTSAPSQAWSKLRLSWRKVLILQGRADLEAELRFTAFDSKSVRARQKCQKTMGKATQEFFLQLAIWEPPIHSWRPGICTLKTPQHRERSRVSEAAF